MKILFVASETHLSGTGGGVTYTRGILSMLEMIDGADLHHLVLPLPLAALPRKVRQGRALGLSLFSRRPSKAHYLLDRRTRRLMRTALSTVTPDVVVFNGADLLPLTDELGDHAKCVLVSHNIETDIIAGQVAGLRVPAAVRRVLRRDVEKTRRMEERGARRMSVVIAISSEDARWYQRLSRKIQVFALCGAFPYLPYAGPRLPAGRPLSVAYLAKMSWWPNRQGAEWLISDILPELPDSTVDVHFFGPGSEQFSGCHPTLHAHGFVESLETVWCSANFTLCPILSGSGTNIKLIESLYNGVPVLATPHACLGLPPVDDPALAVVPPEEWAAFLRSEHAVALAATTVRRETVEQFSARKQAEYLASILGDVSPVSGCFD